MVRLRNAVLGAAAILALSAPLAQSQEAPGGDAAAEKAAKQHAPVLCVWTLLLATQLVGQRCHPGEDPELQAELDKSISRVDAFIMANDHTATKERVDAFKQSFKDQSASVSICANPGAEAMYDDAKKAGPGKIHSDTDDLVAIPRAPTKEGC